MHREGRVRAIGRDAEMGSASSTVSTPEGAERTRSSPRGCPRTWQSRSRTPRPLGERAAPGRECDMDKTAHEMDTGGGECARQGRRARGGRGRYTLRTTGRRDFIKNMTGACRWELRSGDRQKGPQGCCDSELFTPSRQRGAILLEADGSEFVFAKNSTPLDLACRKTHQPFLSGPCLRRRAPRSCHGLHQRQFPARADATRRGPTTTRPEGWVQARKRALHQDRDNGVKYQVTAGTGTKGILVSEGGPCSCCSPVLPNQ